MVGTSVALAGACGGSGEEVCTSNGFACGDDTECCSGVCLGGDGGGSGVGVCTASCAAEGEDCTEDADCCGENFCDDNSNACAVCLSPGSVCCTDSDCCSDACDGAGFCEA